LTEPAGRRLVARIKGLVQGVGFRATTLSEGRRLQLAGWVRNRRNGDVEVLAEGPEPKVRLFLAYLRQGPPHARVDHVVEEWSEAAGAPMPFQLKPTE
jgi:acylphosphatase